MTRAATIPLFTCSKCNGRLEITTTRRIVRGKVVRYRRCVNCDNREKTEEVQKSIKQRA